MKPPFPSTTALTELLDGGASTTALILDDGGARRHDGGTPRS